MIGSSRRAGSCGSWYCEQSSEVVLYQDHPRLAEGWLDGRAPAGSHIRLHKRLRDEVLKLTVPAHHPVKRSTLSHILKQARLNVEEFLELL